MAVVLLQPLVFLLQPPKAVPVVPHAPASRGRLCCRRGLAASTIPTAGQALRRRQPHTAAEPVNPRSPLHAGFHCRVVPFLGLAIVHRHGALRAAWSTWSRNDFLRKSTVCGEADSWVHGHSPVFCDLSSKSLCQACWAANLSRRGELSFGWPRKWPISNEKWAVHF